MADLAKASRPVQRLLKHYSNKLLVKVIVFSLVITGSIAGAHGTLNIPKCASFCTESSKFQYNPANTYIYDYGADVSTYVVHGSSGESRVHLTAKVEITPFSQCDFELKLKDVKLEESELDNPSVRVAIKGSESLVKELEERSLQFAYQNGKIETICSHEEESVWNLNVKRGLLSMLQTNLEKGQQMNKTMQEVDINGRCPTTYSTDDPEGLELSQTVYRRKNLKGCNHRHTHLSGIQSVPYTSSSPIQSIPLLSGVQNCTQIIKDSKIIHVECNEEHNFQPFDYVDSGARTSVVQRLSLVQEQTAKTLDFDAIANSNIRRSGLLFESEVTQTSTSQEIDHILKHMTDLEDKSMAKIRPNAPAYFMELIDELRALSLAALKALHSRASTVGKLFLLDAIPFVGTSPSLGFMSEMLVEKKLSESQIEAWLTSLSFIKNPMIDMIQVLQPLLNEKPKSQALFGMSAMIHSYCQQHDDCTSNPIILTTMRKIYSFLSSCDLSDAPINSERYLNAIYALKSIGNAGRLIKLEDEDENESSSAHLLEKCYRMPSNPIEIRLAAIDAFRRIPCGTYNHHPLVRLMKDGEENTEVRTQAYLILMRCITTDLIESIKDVLYNDQVNQVVSFMWTHLTNLQETSRPDKQLIRELLSNEVLQKKINSDVRKYSRNFEGSKFWEDYNIGAGYDANLIFTPDSFIPRSAMLNLTSHLFGESINLLEFGVRVHSMEQLLEPIFGPAGYFPDQTVNQALHSMRVRRDVANNKMDRLSTVYNQAALELNEPGGSFYTRVFGNEITSKSFRISHKDKTIPTVVDESGMNWADVTHWLDNLSKGKSLEYTKSNVLMDVSYTVPTSAGLPLTLSFQTASTVVLNANGKVDLAKFWENKELEIHGKLRPSAAIQVIGTMSINLGDQNSKLQSGLRIENTLHSSTAVEGKLFLKNGKFVHASLGLPEDKQEMFQAKSQMYIVRTSGEKVLEKGPTDLPKIDVKLCTPKSIETILGIKVCGEVEIPESMGSHFFKSPTAVSVYVQKTDTFTNYELNYKWNIEEEETDIELVFNTPGSKVNRRIATTYKYNREDGFFKAEVAMPTKSLTIDGNYGPMASPKLEFIATSDNQRVFYFNAELKKDKIRLEPRFIIQYYNRSLIEIDGATIGLPSILMGDGRANFDINIKHLTQTRINLNGELTRRGDTYDSSLSLQSYLLSGNLKSNIQLNDNLLLSKMETQFSWRGAEKLAYVINGKIQRSTKGLLTKYYTIYDFTSINTPERKFGFTWELQSGGSYCENNLKVTLGQEFWIGKSVFSNQISRTHKDLRLELLLNAPQRGVDYNFVVSHQEADNGFTCTYGLKWNSQHEFKAHAKYLLGNTYLLKRNFMAAVSLSDWFDYSLKGSLLENKPGEYDGEISLNSSQPRAELKGTLAYKNRSTNTRIDHSLEFRTRNSDTWPLSGSFSLVASEKLSHIGGQLEIAGTEAYNGKWSGSLNYNAPKRHTRKLEGKLSMNEQAYSCVVNYKKTRNGDRTLVADFNLNKRLFMEAQVSGDWPSQTTMFLSFFPDKNHHPNKKLSCQSTIDLKSFNLRVDYFGKLAQFSGNYEQGKGQVEIHWLGMQQFLLSFDVSSLGLRETSFIVNLESPMNTVGISINHRLTPTLWTTQLSGILNEETNTFSINGALGNPESQLSVIFDIAQLRKLQLQLRLLKAYNQLVMDFNSELGEEKSNFRLEYSQTHKGLHCKLEFDGCSFIPKTSVGFSHHLTPSQFTDLDLRWVSLTDGTSQRVNIHVEGEEKPWNYNLLVLTPWSPLDKLEIGLSTEFDTNTHFELIVSASQPFFPVVVKLVSNGDIFHSNHEAVIKWNGNDVVQEIKASANTKIQSWKHAHIASSLEVFGEKYKAELTSRKEKHAHQVEMAVTYVENVARVGFSWQCEKRGHLVKVSGWTEYPTQPKFIIEYRHLNDADYFILDGHVTEDGRMLGQIITEFHSTGFEHWEITAKLHSVLNLVPNISFTSHHSIEDLNEIRHTTTFLLTENNAKLWGGFQDTKILLEFNLKEGKDLNGSVKVNEKEVKLIGVLDNESFEDERHLHGQKIDLEITSELFDSVHVIAGYKAEHDSASIEFSGFRDGTKFIGLGIEGGKDKFKNLIRGRVDILCPFEHQFEGTAKLDFDNKLVDLKFAETMHNALLFELSGQVTKATGHLNAAFNSKFVKYSNNMKISYRLESKKFELEGKFADNSGQASFNSICQWEHKLKKFQVLIENSEKTDFTIELVNSEKLTSYLSYDGDKVWNLVGNYKTEPSMEFGMGKHIVELSFRNKMKNVNGVVTVGLDVNHFMLNLKTPFEGWTDWTLDAQATKSATNFTKTFSLLLANNAIPSDEYNLKIEHGDHLMALSLQTPLQILSNVEAKLKYKYDKTYEASFDGIWDSYKVAISTQVADKKATLEVETPFETFERISASAQWDLHSPIRTIELFMQWNHASHQLSGEWEFEYTQGHVNFVVNTPMVGNHKLGFTYNMMQDIDAKATLEIGDKIKYELSGKLTLGNNEIKLQLSTPFKNYENIELKLHYVNSNVGKHHSGSFEWSVNGKVQAISGELDFEPGKIELVGKSPFQNWTQIAATLNYELLENKKVFEIQLLKEKMKYFHVKSEFKTNGGSLTNLNSNAVASVGINMQTVWPGYEDVNLHTEYQRTKTRHHTISMQAYQNQAEIIHGVLNFYLDQDSDAVAVNINGEVKAPIFNIQLTSVNGSFNSESKSNEKTFLISLKQPANGEATKEYITKVTYQWIPTQFKLYLETPFRPLLSLHIDGHFESDGRVGGGVELNKKRIDLSGQLLWNGVKNFKLTSEIKTPFTNFKNVHVQINSKILARNILIDYIFQNDKLRHMGKVEGLFERSSGQLKVQLNSPIYKFEQVLAAIHYNQSGIYGRLERNTKEEIVGFVSFAEERLEFNLISKITNYPIHAQSIVDFSQGILPSLVLNLDAKLQKSYQLFVETTINGISNGEISIKSSIKYLENFKVKWEIDGDLNGGQANLSWELLSFEGKTIRTSWKNEDFNGVKLEFWLSKPEKPEEEKGFSLQYNYASIDKTNGKFGGTITYVLDKKEEQVIISTALKRAGNTNTMELTLQTPFELVKHFALGGRFISTPEISLDLTASLNEHPVVTSNIVTYVSPLMSKLKFSLNAPMVGEPFNLNVGYDLTTEDKTLDISFTQNKYQLNVKAQAIVPTNPDEIELRMMVDSNVPSVEVSASGSLRAGYKIQSDETRQIVVSVNSEQTGQWKITTSMRPVPSNFNVKFKIDSPIPDRIPSIVSEFQCLRSATNRMDAEMLVQIGKFSPVKATLSLSNTMIQATFKSAIPNFEDLAFDGTLESRKNEALNHKFHIRVRSGTQSCSFEGDIHVPMEGHFAKGSIQLISSWTSIPNASLGVNIATNGTVIISGNLGKRKVNIRSNLQKTSDSVPMWKSAIADVSLSLNAEEVFNLQSKHFFNENEQSLNLTLGDNYKLDTYFKSSPLFNTFSSAVQWAENKQVHFAAEIGSGRFNASIKTPWTSGIQTFGEYKMSPQEYSGKGTCTIDGQQSSLEAVVQTSENMFTSRIYVDVPILSQKVEANMKIIRPDEHYTEGSIDMKMRDRRIAIKGSLASSKHKHGDNIEMDEKLLKLTISLPIRKYSEMNGELSIKKPVGNLNRLQLDSSVTVGVHNVKGRFHYQLPLDGTKVLAAGFVLDAPILSPDKYEGYIDINDVHPLHFKGEIQYKSSSLFVSWNIEEDFYAKIAANVPTILPDLSPINLEMKGMFKPKEAHVRTTISWQQSQLLTVQLSLLNETNGYSGRVFMHAPFAFPESCELALRIQKLGPTRHSVDVTASYGKDSFGSTGELMYGRNAASASLKLSGYFGTHYIQIGTKRTQNINEIELNAESMTLLKGKKMSTVGKFGLNANGFEGSIECRTRQSTHTITTSLNLKPTHGAFSIKVESPYVKTVNFDTEYSIETNAASSLKAKLSANIMNKCHSIKFGYDMNYFEAYLSILSPAFTSQVLNIHLKSKVKDHIDILADFNLLGHEWKVETKGIYVADREVEVKLEFRTPFESMHRFTFAIALSSAKIHLEFYTPFEELPTFVISLSDVPLFENINLYTFKPQILVGLPWVTYSTSAMVELPSRTKPGEINFMVGKGNPSSTNGMKQFKFGVRISPIDELSLQMDETVHITLTMSTPYQHFRSFECGLGGRVNLRSWSEINLNAELNGKEIGFTSEVQREEATKKFVFTLKTPFEKFERTTFSIRLENYEEIGTGRNIQLNFDHSALQFPIRTEIDYHYRIFEFPFSMDGEFTLHLPNPRFTPLVIRFKSALADANYDGLIEGHFGQYQPSLKVNAGFSHERVFGSGEMQLGEATGYQALVRFDFRQQPHELSFLGEAQVNNRQILIANIGFAQKLDQVKCHVLFKTPVLHLSSISAELRISPLSRADSVTFEQLLHTLDISLGITYNEIKLFQFEVVSKHNQRSFEIHNPIQPISFIISYKILPNKKLQVISEFCWNLKHPMQNTVGVKLNYGRNPFGSDILLKVQAAEFGSIEIDTSNTWSYTKLEQNLNITLFGSTSFGYYVLFSEDVALPSNNLLNKLILRIDLPWRSLQTDYQLSRSGSNRASSTTNFDLKWDVAKDPTKRMGITSTYDSVSYRRSVTNKGTLLLRHSALPHELIFELEKTYKHGRLWESEFIFKPNPAFQDHFTVRLSRENIKEKGIQIMITHPATNVDINTIMSYTKSSALFHVAYMDVSGARHVMHFEMKKEAHDRHLELSVGPNVQSLSPLLKIDIIKKDEVEHEISLKTPFLQVESHVRHYLPYMDAQLRFDSGEEISFAIGLTHKKKLIVQILRNEFGQEIQDFLFVAKFNHSDILSTGLFWNPETANQVKEYSKTFPTVLLTAAENWIPKLGEIVNEEIEERLRFIGPGVDRIYIRLKTHASKEFELLKSEFIDLSRSIKYMYSQNTFYLKDIGNLFEKGLHITYDYSFKLFSVILDTPIKALEIISKVYSKIEKFSIRYSGSLEKIVMGAWKSAENVVAKLWEKYMKKISHFLAKGQAVYDTFMAAFDGNMGMLEERFYGVGLIRKIICLYEDYMSWLQELPMQAYINQLRQLFRENVIQPLEVQYKPYFDVVNQIIEDGNLYSILEIPPIPYIRYISSSVIKISDRLWEFVGAEQRVRDLVGELLGRLTNMIQRHIPLAQLDFRTEKGHIEFHQPLVFVDWEDFTHMPKWKVAEQDKDDLSYMREITYTILDTIHFTQPFRDLNMREVLPPFGASAFMTEDLHYLTFDKKYFRFAGECSYILMADLANKNFTLVVNYENTDAGLKRKSYSLISGNSAIEIDTEHLQVTLDGRKVELPLEVGPTIVRRQPNGIELFDTRGFQMNCNSLTCSVFVSGWHFGKLGGLLGTYDYEPNNDFRTPDGQIVSDVANFAHSWRIGPHSGKCRMRNYAREFPTYYDSDGVCHDHFVNLNAQLRACFNMVPVQPFMEMCKYDTTRNLNSIYRREAACASVSAYVAECQRHNVDLWMTPTCVKCRFEDGSRVTMGENVTISEETYTKPPNSADIVIIVEEGSLLKNFNLNDIVNKLEVSLKLEGLTDNRYAVVGYGGAGIYKTPHVRTSAGQVWSSNTLLKIPRSFPMNGVNNGDLYQAIEYSASLGFRAGVAKTFVALIADDESSAQLNREYTDTLTLLIENDIKLHIMSPKNITYKGNKRDDGNKIFGLDRNGIFTLWQSKRGSLTSDKSLKRYVRLPKDFYTPLALETGGIRFNMNHLNSPFNKTFLDVWSRLVAKSSHPSICQYCECFPDKFGGAVNHCQQCISPTLQKFLDNWNDVIFDDEDLLMTTSTTPTPELEKFDYEDNTMENMD